MTATQASYWLNAAPVTVVPLWLRQKYGSPEHAPANRVNPFKRAKP